MAMSPVCTSVALVDAPGVTEAFAPAYEHGGAGADLRSRLAVSLAPGACAQVPLGVRLELPRGTVGLICPKARLAAERGLTLANGVGPLDPGYREELTVRLWNTSDKAVEVACGDAVAQLVIVPVCMTDFRRSPSLD